uniref:Putative scavenger receptor cysteine-rich protein n=1 Tax=Rhipicephalus microplus TaxID=6941 RepID=A0A6G5A7L6_RHIMP
MHYIVILLATSYFGLIDGSRNCTNCGPEGCSSLEEPVVGKPRKDRFCKARFTPSWEKDKLRKCVCKRGFVRNSWGECISKKDCWRCKLRLYNDWRSCASACPTTCGQPVLTDCQKKCSSGCECIPGYVVHPKRHHKCVKADSCLPKCPTHSTFKPCVSSCEPKCSEKHPKSAFTVATREDAFVTKATPTSLEIAKRFACKSHTVACSLLHHSLLRR